ncbi:MAG: hypothetical protein HF560_07720 [Synechococcus sp. MIT S9220]|uniref:hypothetical protein n=1 Tax=unclassified Synechococcus TaxID=2626047 RepID=UPI00164CA54D|nr:hypothetical protein [Synechococcus sp. MIT S9220]NOL47460.1 hypothetical protein [Synechococcus sp. MIT S9220]
MTACLRFAAARVDADLLGFCVHNDDRQAFPMKFLFIFFILLPAWFGSANANESKRPYSRWQDYNYTFKGRDVNRCVNKAFKYLVVSGFDEDADSSVNEKGTYGYAYGWTSDLSAQATIICDMDDSESVLKLVYSAKAYKEKDSLWKVLKSGKW